MSVMIAAFMQEVKSVNALVVGRITELVILSESERYKMTRKWKKGDTCTSKHHNCKAEVRKILDRDPNSPHSEMVEVLLFRTTPSGKAYEMITVVCPFDLED